MKTRKLIVRTVGLGLNLYAFVTPRRAAATAFKLFTKPPRPVLREKEEQFLETAAQQTVSHAGVEVIEYHWGEEGPLALLAYGWGYNAGRWRHFVPRLVEAGYRVIAFDPPGHGLAPKGRLNLVLSARIVASLIEAHGRPDIIIGHSFGGASSVLALSRLSPLLHPDRLVLMASFSEARSVFQQFRQTLGLSTALYWGFIRHLEALTEYTVDDFDLARLSAQLPHLQGLIVHDPKDHVTPFRHAGRYHAYWPGSALLKATGGGHHLGQAHLTDTILDFAVNGVLPDEARIQERPLPAGHDLVRYFAGLE